MAASRCPRLYPPSSVSVCAVLPPSFISQLCRSLWEQRDALSTRCRPQRLPVRWLEEQSCLATLEAAGRHFSWWGKRFRCGVDVQGKSGVVRLSVCHGAMAASVEIAECPLVFLPLLPERSGFGFTVWNDALHAIRSLINVTSAAAR